MMMLCNNVTTPVAGGANTRPDSDTLTSDTGLESKPGNIRSSSSAARAMESASVGCLWCRRESACACGEEGGWRRRREERAAVRQRPARDTSSWLSPLTNRDVRTSGRREEERGRGREGEKRGREGEWERGKGRKRGRKGEKDIHVHVTVVHWFLT